MKRLLQLRVLRFGFLQDGDVGVGVFPEGEEIFVGGERSDPAYTWQLMNLLMGLIAAFAAMRLLRILSYVGMVILSAVALVHWTRARINPRRPLGLILDWKTITDFGVGTLIGTLAIFGVFFAEWLLGLLQTRAVVSSNTHTMWFGLSYLVSVFIEELISNGLMLSGLVLVVRQRWLAVALMAAIFGFLHAMTAHATPLSVLSSPW